MTHANRYLTQVLIKPSHLYVLKVTNHIIDFTRMRSVPDITKLRLVFY